jgi:hypothetical protein
MPFTAVMVMMEEVQTVQTMQEDAMRCDTVQSIV